MHSPCRSAPLRRVNRLSFRGQAEHHAQAAALALSAGDYSVVHRGVPRSVVMRCPTGCGDLLTINLDPRAGKAWQAQMHNGALTLYPSVWRHEGCRAHFIVWRNALLWCDATGHSVDIDPAVTSRVECALTPGTYTHYEKLADALTIHPWEVLWACRHLERAGKAKSRDREYFASAQRRRWW